VGVDSKNSFNPKGTLTRAQGVVMLVRAGYTTAADKPTTTTTTTTTTTNRVESSEAWANIKKLGTWKEVASTFGTGTTIKFTDAKYGGIQVTYYSETGKFKIYMPERDDELMYDSDDNFIDVNGKVIDWPYNQTTYEYYASTAYSLEARQFCKKIAACILGTEGIDEFYAGLKGVFLGTSYDRGGGRPTSVKWVGNRGVSISNGEDYAVTINITGLDDQASYKLLMANRIDGMQITPTYYLGLTNSITAFKLNQW
jgi:hypothetical protein